MLKALQYLTEKNTSKKSNVHVQKHVHIVICTHKSRKMFEHWELLDVDTQFKAGKKKKPPFPNYRDGHSEPMEHQLRPRRK